MYVFEKRQTPWEYLNSPKLSKEEIKAKEEKEKELLDSFQKQAEENVKAKLKEEYDVDIDKPVSKFFYKLQQKALKYAAIGMMGLATANTAGCFDKYYPDKPTRLSVLVDHSKTNGFVVTDFVTMWTPLLALMMALEPKNLDLLPDLKELSESLTKEEKKKFIEAYKQSLQNE